VRIDDAFMDANFGDFAKRDRGTNQQTDGLTDIWTDTLAYWDAMDASKNFVITASRIV